MIWSIAWACGQKWLTDSEPITGELGKDYRALVLCKNPHLTALCVRWDPSRELANCVPSFDWMCGACGIANRLMPRPSFLEMVLCRNPDCPSRSEPDWRRLQLARLHAVSNDLLSIHVSEVERKAEIAFCYGRCVAIILLHFLDLAQSSGYVRVCGLRRAARATYCADAAGVAAVKHELDVVTVVGAGPALTEAATTKKGSPTGRK